MKINSTDLDALSAFLSIESLVYAALALIGLFTVIIAIQIIIKRNKSIKLKKSGISEIENMDGFQFEHYLAALFKHQGYKVDVTSSRGDYGADLIIKKDSNTIAVQAKRYSTSVGIKAVQEILGAASYYQTNEAWVVATNKFTKQARELASRANVKLIDKDKLIAMILKMNPDARNIATKTLEEVKTKDIRCNKCGNKMSVKKGKYGRFYGCNNYPNCNHTKKLG